MKNILHFFLMFIISPLKLPKFFLKDYKLIYEFIPNNYKMAWPLL